MYAPNGTRIWSPAEDKIIGEHFAAGGADKVFEHLTERSVTAIRKRANALGIRNRPQWTPRDDLRLIYLWSDGKMGLETMAEQLGHSEGSIYRRAGKLGLGTGCPSGYEYLTEAARRTNFAAHSLRPILEWAGVKLRIALSCPSKKKIRRKARRHYVDPEQVDRAIVSWMKHENLAEAARSRGVHDETLRRYLVADGVIRDRKGTRKYWRIPSKEIDRVVAARRPDKARSAA